MSRSMDAPLPASTFRTLILACIVWLGGQSLLAEDAAPPPSGGPTASGVPVPEAVSELAEKVNQDPRAREATAGILQPIYRLAETMAHPAFHWIAFTVMATGVVNYALQLVLGKLVVLTRLSLSLKEILSDALGLVISLTGLVLTTQAAAENSTFTTSPAAVLSASALGVVGGFIFYLWGQRLELEAARGRAVEKK